MKRALAAVVFTLAVVFVLAAQFAAADGLKLPPPTAEAPPPSAAEPTQFVIMSAALLAQIQALIEAQRREIERLRAAKSTGRCI